MTGITAREVFKMIIPATKFKTNIGKYLSVVKNEDIMITKNGKFIAKLVSAEDNSNAITTALKGVINRKDISLEKEREERLSKYA